MARDSLRAPRAATPDIPDSLDPVAGIARADDLVQARIEGLSGTVDAAHAHVAECVVAAASVDRLDLTGASLSDVEITDLRATELRAVESRWRNVRLTGGRIGTLDLRSAELDGVELRGIRIDYLALPAARVNDLVVADCVIGALDLPQATLTRVRFEDSRADEVDTRGLRSEHLDLRGLEAVSYTDPAGLRRATLSFRQVEHLAPALATALGIRVDD